MLTAWISGTILFWLAAYLLSQLLRRVHLAFVGWLIFGILAAFISFDLFMSMGGGLAGTHRVVFATGCIANGVAGVIVSLAAAIRSRDGMKQWRQLYWQGTIRERSLRFGTWLIKGLWSVPVLLFAIVVAVFLFDFAAMASLKPRSHERLFEEFVVARGVPQHLAIVQQSDTEFLVWTGKRPSTLVPVSGPPCYVFDNLGELVDYSLDTGDDHHLAQYMDAAWEQKPVTVEEARQFLAQQENNAR